MGEREGGRVVVGGDGWWGTVGAAGAAVFGALSVLWTTVLLSAARRERSALAVLRDRSALAVLRTVPLSPGR